MKKLFFCALAAAVLAAAGCSKDDEMSGNAKVGGSDYTIIAADAYWWWDVDNWSNTELILWTSYVDYFYIDLYWDGEVRDWLREGTYTLGGDVLDEVAYDNENLPDIGAQSGTLTISGSQNGYSIRFSGTDDTDGQPMEINYTGKVNFWPM